MSEWETIVTDEFIEWFKGLDADARKAVNGGLALLRMHGPVLGRPHVEGGRQDGYEELG